MAFSSVDDFQTALDACLSVRDWETLTESIQIPEAILPQSVLTEKLTRYFRQPSPPSPLRPVPQPPANSLSASSS